MRRSLKWVLRGFAGILALTFIVAGAVGFTLSTQAGTRWAIDKIDAGIPGSISIEQFTGTLWAGLRVPIADYRDSLIDLHVVDAELSIDWASIPSGRFSLKLLTARSVVYRNLSPEDPDPEAARSKPFELKFNPLPVSLGVEHGRIGSLTVMTNADPVVITEILLDDASLNDVSLRVSALSVSFGDIQFSVSDLNSDLAGDVPLRMGVRWVLAGDVWSGSGTFRGTLATLEFEHVVAGLYPASANGELRLLHRVEPDVDATIRWERWLIGDYVLESGETIVHGNNNDYQGEFGVTALIPGIAPTRIRGSASGNMEQITAFDAHADNPAGSADLVGSLAWRPAFTAEARIHASGFDPAPFVQQLTGSLDADFHLQVSDGGNFNITNAVVTGVLNDASINANGSMAVAAEQFRCVSCVLNVGSNRINVDGFYGRGDDVLAFSIVAPSLEALWPEFSGSLDGEGQLTGAATNPLFTGELRGKKLNFEHWSADEVSIVSRGSTLDVFDLSAAVTSFSVDETDAGSFTVTGKGAPESVDFTLAWEIRGLGLNAEGNIERSADAINGILTTASITEPKTGRWSLQDRLSFEIVGRDVSLSRHVWSGELGEIKVDRLSRVSDEIELLAGIEGFPLQFANPLLPGNIQLSGSANASIDVKRHSDQWTGSIDWKQMDTVLTVVEANQEQTEVRVPRSEIHVDLNDHGAKATAALTVEPGVTADLDITFAELTSVTPITAELRLQGKDWYWIPAVFPVIDNFEGAISATISATGPLLSPQFSGSLNWNDGSLAVPSFNVPVTEINLTVLGSSAGAATVSATAKAGEGDLSIKGIVENVMRASRSINMRVHGSTAELINWPEYHLWGSPDLVVVGTREGWFFSGRLEIPRAEIAVTELSDNAVMPSSDVVVVGREESSVEKPARIDGVARLVFGDQVHVTAFGLDTKLRGELQVRMFHDRPISAEGRVNLAEGVFAAYGQKLTIQEGTLTFTGPLDNPIVDVRAVRVIEALEGPITAGIHLQGRAQQITSTVYSDPAMSEADALSYLLVGRPLSQATQTEGGELSSAALALGIGQAGRITEQVGQALGLDELTVAGDGGDSTALVAGMQINSRLHARYAYGVFSRLGTLLIRYRLSNRLSLEAGAGEAQSIDLLYLVEKE